MFCTKCGHPNKTGARFCANCGDPLKEDTTLTLNPVDIDDEGEGDHAHLQEDLEPGQALLVVKHGPKRSAVAHSPIPLCSLDIERAPVV